MKVLLFTLAIYGVIGAQSSPRMLLLVLPLMMSYFISGDARLKKQLRALKKFGYLPTHTFITSPTKNAPVRGLAVDSLGRVAVHDKGKWEGVQLLDVVITADEDVAYKTTASRSILGAVAGACVAGPVGAVIGGTGRATRSSKVATLKAVDLVLTVNCLENPVRVLSFGKDASAAREWYGRLVAAQMTKA